MTIKEIKDDNDTNTPIIMKTKTVNKLGLTTDTGIRYNGKSKLILGQYDAEILEINHAKREIRLLIHTHFTPQDIKQNPQALAAVERMRDAACHYLTVEGFLDLRNKPCASAEWCVRAGVLHDRPNDQSRINRLPS